MPRRSPSKETINEPKQPHAWLLKHYQEKRERTITLVKAAVDQLVKEGQSVTIEAICRMSATVDTQGRGVKKSAILENPEAHAYYREHSTSYQAAQDRKRQGKRKGLQPARNAVPLRIDLNRDVDRVRYRYWQMNKNELIERLLTVEHAYAEIQQQLAMLQFQLVEQEQQRANEQRQAGRQFNQKGENTQNHDRPEEP